MKHYDNFVGIVFSELQIALKSRPTYHPSSPTEQFPASFVVNFEEFEEEGMIKVRITKNGKQVGDVIDDNSYEEDYYRFHDVFHYTFATYLGWSPCTRAMFHLKRKSIPHVDIFEDGARATITEEAISLMVFNEAKRSHFFKQKQVPLHILELIKHMTASFEVHNRSSTEWKTAILKGYELFQELVTHRGGQIRFDLKEKKAFFLGHP